MTTGDTVNPDELRVALDELATELQNAIFTISVQRIVYAITRGDLSRAHEVMISMPPTQLEVLSIVGGTLSGLADDLLTRA